MRVKRELRAAGNGELSDIASALDYLVAFNRGHRIAAGLTELWLATGSYAGARTALDHAFPRSSYFPATTTLKESTS